MNEVDLTVIFLDIKLFVFKPMEGVSLFRRTGTFSEFNFKESFDKTSLQYSGRIKFIGVLCLTIQPKPRQLFVKEFSLDIILPLFMGYILFRYILKHLFKAAV